MGTSNISESYTLITGASDGIGREMAELFAQKGNNLVLVARRKNILEDISENLIKLYKVKILTMPCDLSEKETPKAIYEWCKGKDIIIDTIVNNAGRGLFGQFNNIDIEEQINMINLNISSLVMLNYYFIPDLLKLSKGFILNVASIAALYPLPYYSVYGATKAFVLSFTEALRYELRNSNIIVSCLCPGDTDTNFFINAGNEKRKKPSTSPHVVADVAVRSLFRDEPVIFPDKAKLIAKIPRFILKKKVFKRISKYKV
ncbi:MAG TPA: SDR family oxidoreductase [Syntrophomonadaceae bacterium]|nr:SDR family oxidoreductase [Syntrophomonadaceae bacterium]